VYTVLVAEPEDRRHFGKTGHSWVCEIIINHEEIWLEEVVLVRY
jgi:hypothetical protein